MNLPVSQEKCEHCGSAIAPPGAYWHATSERRIVQVGEPFQRIVGRIPVGGIFPHTEAIDLAVVKDQRFETERLWVRQWAEHEWRRG